MNKNKLSIFAITMTLIFAQILIHPALADASVIATNTTTASAPTIVDVLQGSDISVNLINQNPDPALSGNTVELRIGIQNKGQNKRDNVVMELIPSYPFTALQGQSLIDNLGTLSGNQVDNNQQVVKFDLGVDPQATKGSYNLKIWTYTDGNRNTHTETVVPVDVDTTKNVQVIYVDKTVVIPGQETPVTFTINNVGKSPLNNVQFSWQTTNNVLLSVGGTSSRYIDTLEVGKSANVTYDVIASTSISADLYPMQLTLSYDDPTTGGKDNYTTIAGIYIGGDTNFDVSYGGSANGQMSFNIANTGSNPAAAVTITVPKQNGWRVTGAETSMIGSLNKGDYTIASFSLTPAGKNNSINVEVDYTNTKGDRINDTYAVEVTAQTGNATGFSGGTRGAAAKPSLLSTIFSTTNIIIALVVLAIIGGAIYYYKSKSKVKKK